MIRNMALDELRAARNLTQEQLARTLGVAQAAVSKMERRTDMYISTLQTAIKAMGGYLEIRAVFPEGTVRIHQFRDIERSARRPPRRRSSTPHPGAPPSNPGTPSGRARARRRRPEGGR
jgi:transcriptional regulator with XRE-family HTH domain